jgi:hypothetical protein
MTAKLVDYKAAPDAPSIEDHLRAIRDALALTVMLHAALAQADDLCLDSEMKARASAKVADLCEDAWGLAEELAEAMPGPMHSLHIVRSKGGK